MGNHINAKDFQSLSVQSKVSIHTLNPANEKVTTAGDAQFGVTVGAMKTAVINVIVLGVLSGLASGAGLLPDGPLIAAAGETVMFNTTLTPPETPFVSVAWKSINVMNIEKPIITSTANNITEPDYADRITLFRSTGSLELRNLDVSDSGQYIVTITPDGGALMTGISRLEVLDPVSNITVNVSDTDLVEFSSSASLSCSSSGSSLTFLWLNGSSEVTASDRVELTDGGQHLTIKNVMRYDQGPFRCRASNAVSDGTSDPVQLPIIYGPDNVRIWGPTKLEVKQDLILICSAESGPEADYFWKHNGKDVLNNSFVFSIITTECSDGGTFICQARNKLTGRTSFGEHSLSLACGVLSPGAIAGIVVACLVVAGAALAGGFLIYKKKVCRRNRKSKTQPQTMTHMHTHIPKQTQTQAQTRAHAYEKEQDESVYENEIYENNI